MFSTETTALKAAIAAVALFGLGGTALAQSTVVRAGGPSARSYPAGKSLAANAKIALVAGDSLTILDAKGTRTLRGPGTYSANGGAAAPDKRTAFNALVSTQNRKQSRTGAVREVGTGKVIAQRPNLWLVDVQSSATMCLADPAKVQLWRPDMEKAQTVTIRNDTTGKAATVTWGVGRSEAPWPAALPVADGASYSLSRAGAAAPVKLKMATVDAAIAGDPATLAAALHAKGCTPQFDLLAARLGEGG
ncbi:hypothetical protein [Sphingobium boeckii]|uniref:DUF4412 domain-containing protein n=1 Tax=Sphingobium boeckii TaxID=1082345 RepID=A0A7W9AI45_9SPHN|nr:hypothetical protein [Sphingobium boeckii]MBB5685846.1 hypothetical protein [Sphingobium boeckii]